MSVKGRRNLVIGQSGGATAVINASLVGAFETAREDEHFDEIYHKAARGPLHLCPSAPR